MSAIVKQLIKSTVADNRVVVFSKSWCPFSKNAKQLLNDLDTPYYVVELDIRKDGAEIQQALAELTGQKTVPNIFINNRHIGGFTELQKSSQSGILDNILTEAGSPAP